MQRPSFYKILLLGITSLSHLYSYQVSFITTKKSPSCLGVTAQISLQPGEILYSNSFTASSDNPSVHLSSISSQGKAESFFDPIRKTHKEGYKDHVLFSFNVCTDKKTCASTKTTVYTSFELNTKTAREHALINVDFERARAVPTQLTPETTQEHQPSKEENSVPSTSFLQKIISYLIELFSRWKGALSSLFASTSSRSTRFAVTLTLGILLSLTPCIYPMIPITIGILQTSHSSSFLKNFSVAFSYTLGISTTFALLGFITALGSAVFGELQSSPFVILPLAFILGYLGLALFGFYDMYIPKFLRPKGTKVVGGSYIAAFTFGMISGTVASPCLSPGLALVMNYVGHITVAGSYMSYLEGIVLLFVFGIGSSLPLLIIGTFSTSVSLMPRAGSWMVEVKKLLGLMLIAMVFYHLEKLISWYLLIWGVVLFLFFIGSTYFRDIMPYDSKKTRIFKVIMGALFIISACLTAVQGIKEYFSHKHAVHDIHLTWSHEYQTAYNQAAHEHKRLFVDVSATYCAACKKLQKTVLHTPEITAALTDYIPVFIEADRDIDSYEQLKNEFGSAIHGYPTLLIIDPQDKKLVMAWGFEQPIPDKKSLTQELTAHAL